MGKTTITETVILMDVGVCLVARAAISTAVHPPLLLIMVASEFA